MECFEMVFQNSWTDLQCLLTDAPNVTVDSNVIHTGPDEETKITCNFDANPEVIVRTQDTKSRA